MAAPLPRIASVIVYISAQQPMRQGAWRWGPTWKLPNGLNGAWALNEAENVAVRCENVDGLTPRSTDWLERALDAAMNAEAIARRNDHLRDHLWREAGLKPETGVRRAAPRPRTPKARLATAVERQLEEILRQS